MNYYPESEMLAGTPMQPFFVFQQHTYSGFEPAQAFDIVYGSHFEHRLLSPGRARMEHHRLVMGDVRIETGCYDFPVIAQGAMPRDVLSIGMVAEGAETTRYNTEFIGDDEIQVYGPGAELMYHAAGASRWINFTVHRETLAAAVWQRLRQPLTLPGRGVASFRLPPGRRLHLRQLAYDSIDLAKALKPAGMGRELALDISRSLISAYADALCAAEVSKGTTRTETARRHYQIILACERLVRERGMTDVDLSELARRCGYSLRALELIFRHGVGMAPNRWFINIRLNGALRDLLSPDAECSVSGVALRWGFRHMARFAERYRHAFGELPSQTLRRARA